MIARFMFFYKPGVTQVPRDAGGPGGVRSNLHRLHGNMVRIRRLDLGSLCRRPGLRGRWILLGTCSLCQSMQSLNCSDGSGAVTPHGEDTGWGRHLQDQIPIMGNGHETLECRPANDSIEREVHLRYIELDALCAEVLLGPERDRQSDA